MTGVGFEGGIDLYGGKIVSFGIITESISLQGMSETRGKSSIVQLSDYLSGVQLTANKRIVLMASWSSSV